MYMYYFNKIHNHCVYITTSIKLRYSSVSIHLLLGQIKLHWIKDHLFPLSEKYLEMK